MRAGFAVSALSALTNFLLPPTCGVCRTVVMEQGALCPACWQRLSFIAEPCCACCGVPFDVPMAAGELCAACLTEPPPFSRARAALVYDEASRRLIGRFKYRDQTFLLPTLLPWLERAARDLAGGVDGIVPVPMHRWRLWRRTYNQAALFARALGKRLEIPVSLEGLVRVRHTLPQVGLDAAARQKNVQSAFRARTSKVAGKTLLLVDDVHTTGATLQACTVELLKQGAREVRVLTLARVVRPETVTG